MTPSTELDLLFAQELRAIPKPAPLAPIDPVDADEAYLWAGDGWLDIATDERFYADDFGNGVFVPFYAEPFYFQEH